MAVETFGAPPLRIRFGSTAERGNTPAAGIQTGTLWLDVDSGNCSIGLADSAGTRSWSSVGSYVLRNDTNTNSPPRLVSYVHTLSAGVPANGIGGVLTVWVQTGATANDVDQALEIVSEVTDVTAGSVDSKVTFKILVGSAQVNGLEIEDPTVAEDVALLVRVNDGGVFSVRRVSMGADDSGGAGFRLLRVPN